MTVQWRKFGKTYGLFAGGKLHRHCGTLNGTIRELSHILPQRELPDGLTQLMRHAGYGLDPATRNMEETTREIARLIVLGALRLRGEDPLDNSLKGAPGSGSSEPKVFDAEAAAEFAKLNAEEKPLGLCAKYVRRAIEDGGGLIMSRPNPMSAKNYDVYLLKNGFKDISASVDGCRAADIVVIQNYEGGSIHGHIALFSGDAWYSDFKQRDFWGGSGYRKNQPKHAFYRWPIANRFE